MQVMSVGASARYTKQKREQSDVGESMKVPRMQTQAEVVLEKEWKQSTGSEALSSTGIHTG
jgi:hypothetical protein